LAELRQKLAEKRAVQSKEDLVANKANEVGQINIAAHMTADTAQNLRRKAGQDAGKIKDDLELKEVQKEAERKKQGELSNHIGALEA